MCVYIYIHTYIYTYIFMATHMAGDGAAPSTTQCATAKFARCTLSQGSLRHPTPYTYIYISISISVYLSMAAHMAGVAASAVATH